MTAPSAPRRSGVMVPLFSLSTRRSWGIGEFADLPAFAAWCRAAGQTVIQLLPLNEMSPGESSPYSSMTAMALDPLYIAVPDVPDFVALGGEEGLPGSDREALMAVRNAERLRYADVRALKDTWLRRSFVRFSREEVAADSPRAAAFEAYCAQEAWWLDEYARFRAIHAWQHERAWWDWPAELRAAEAAAVAAAGNELAAEVRYRAWLQWLAAGQWQAARRASRLAVFGDLPFMVSADSPDVWARQSEFRFDTTVGVPPDAFSATGQDWGLPPWRWEVMAANGFTWMKARARRTAALYDGIRLDHLVGLYRTYMRYKEKPEPPADPGFFVPGDEAAQTGLGEQLVRLYQDSGVEVVAEDLGVVPDFVRASITALGVPGFKVMRWERQWTVDRQPLVEPADYPDLSVALTGTHDTETLVEWWAAAPDEERAGLLALPHVARRLPAEPPPFVPRVRDAILQTLEDSGSRLVILPLQDVFGWDDRINRPATVGQENWTWRVPQKADEWRDAADWVERARALRNWTRQAGRT